MNTIKKYSEAERLQFARSIVRIRLNDEIHPSVKIGPGTVIGEDGFGYVRQEDKSLLRMPHEGNVVIENDVEIGSNTCIDRAAHGASVIGVGTIVDYLVHVAPGLTHGTHCLGVAGEAIADSN